MSLVGDRDPRSHKFSVLVARLRCGQVGREDGCGVFDRAVQCLAAQVGSRWLDRCGRGDGRRNLETIHNAVSLAELAVEKGAKSLLLPVGCRRQLFDLSDEMATKIDIEFYQDARDALTKSLAE